MIENDFTENENLIFTAKESGERLDSFVSASAEISRSRAQKLIEDGFVTVGGQRAAKNCKLKAGDVVEIELPEP